jgi:hypothetical protein
VYFPVRLTFLGRLMIGSLLLSGAPAVMLYVWCRLNPRPYTGALTPILGTFVSGGALDALEGSD